MEHQEVLIVGQGLAGTWLAWWLHRAGIPFKIIDRPERSGASLRAAGLINPVTGRRMVSTWLISELLPFSRTVYGEIGAFLNDSFLEETSVVDFFPTVQMLQSFQKRYEEDREYLFLGEDREKYAEWFRYEMGWGGIRPVFLVTVEKLLVMFRNWLREQACLEEAEFDMNLFLPSPTGIEYAGTRYRYILFCDGIQSATNPYFEKLPFALNKGEGMLVEIPGLPANQVFKKGMSLIPYRENMYWLGSSYEWEFADDQPSAAFRLQSENWLRNTIKGPFAILEHFAAIRPATLERRPFVGFHPSFPSVGILNGLGTKGCSLAPYFAKQLADQMAGGLPIDPLADIRRFGKILGRPGATH